MIAPGLQPEGDTFTLHRFHGELSPQASQSDTVARVIFVDVETTGLYHDRDQVIEIGLLEAEVDKISGQLIQVGREISELQDPGKPLSQKIVSITGITDEMLKGQSIDWQKVNQILEGADWVIAHNAGFDRPFIDASAPASKDLSWACSLSQIAWSEQGHRCRALEHLCRDYGFFFSAHRALMDVKAMAHLLFMPSPKTGNSTLLGDLMVQAARPDYFVKATNSPFEKKDLLKEKGFRWNRDQRVWEMRVNADDVQDIRDYLASEIYSGPSKAEFVHLDPKSRFQR